MQAAVIRFHSRSVDVIKSNNKAYDRENNTLKDLSDEALFERARDNTTHYYHRVVLEDFLFHVVGQEMIQDIAQNGRAYYFRDGFRDGNNTPRNPFMPVEFSVAAFRFGHSQIRNEYRLNENPPTPLFHARDSTRGGTLRGFQPLTPDRKIDWEHFFELPVPGRRSAQHAFKIDPTLPAPLMELPVPVVADGVTSLAARNLVRGRTFRLPAGDRLAEKMRRDGKLLGGESMIIRIQSSDQHPAVCDFLD